MHGAECETRVMIEGEMKRRITIDRDGQQIEEHHMPSLLFLGDMRPFVS